MRNIELSENVSRQVREIRSGNKQLYRKLQKQLDTFRNNPEHPSLRLHKLRGRMKNIWSISIDKDIRMIFIKEEKMDYFVGLGTHDEVYRK